MRWVDSASDDGRADPGDTVQVQVDVSNSGDGSAGNISSVLAPIGGGVSLGSSASEYPYIPADASATNTSVYTFTIDPNMPPGSILQFQQVITAGVPFSNTFRIPIGISQFGDPATTAATDLPRALPDDDPAGIVSTIERYESGTVGDVNVQLSITHPLPADVALKLISPRGSEVMLARQPSGAGTDMPNALFDDAAATSVIAASTPFSGTFQPETPLSVLNGQPIAGQWQLQAIDMQTGNVGTIDGWSLEIRPLIAVCSPQGNDFCPPTASIDTTSIAVDEAGASATVTVILDHAVERLVNIYYYTQDGTARWNTYPSDYQKVSGGLSFAPGQVSQTIAIPISNDQLAEPDEIFTLSLLDIAPDVHVGTPSTATITILDDDRRPAVAWADTSLGATEGTTATLTVRLSEPARKPIQVVYTANDWNATAGSDYPDFAGTLSFAPGEISQTLSLPIADDALPEPEETLYVHLSNPINATLGSAIHAQVTIEANDCADTYEPDSQVSEARAISVGTSQRHAFCSEGDEDWASFSAAAGATYRIETRNDESGVDTVLELYAGDGTTIVATDDDGGGNLASRIKFIPDATGTYYIKVRRYGGYGDPSSLYDLRVTDMSAATPQPTSGQCGDTYEPDGSSAQATTIALYETQTHAFCQPGDTDWLSFSAEAGTTYTIGTANLAHDVDTVLELYGSDGTTLLAQNDDDYGDASSLEFTPATSGTYYVRVRHASTTWGDPSYEYDITLSEGYGGGGT